MNLHSEWLFQHDHVASPQLARALAADRRAGRDRGDASGEPPAAKG